MTLLFMTLPLIKDLLTRHKMLAADFLESNYDEVNAFYLQQTNAIFLNEKIMKEFVELFFQNRVHTRKKVGHR